MNDEMFIKKYEELLDKGYCDCNEMNCIDNNTPRRILNVVKNLQQENQKLKAKIKTYEDPEDLTLMFMYCNEKAKDKIKELEEQLKIKHDGFMASIDESCELAEEIQKYKEVIDKLKNKLMEYFEVGKDCYFYVLTRDKSAFYYGTMSFDDFKEFSEEQVDDIIDFLKEVE